MIRKLSLAALLFAPLQLLAQGGYKLDFHIKELKDTTIYLGYYFGESTFIKDTAQTDKDGRFTFSSPKRLDRGIYFLVKKKSKLFEPGFIVGDNQHFSMETSTADIFRNMKVTGDEDNQLFFANMLYNADRHKEAEPLLKILRDSTLTEDQKKEARAEYMKIDKKVQDHQNDVIARYPKTLTAKLLKMNRRPDVPPPPKKADGSIDSSFQYRYYKKHYFDNFDLAEEAFMRLPTAAYQEKLYEYLDKMVFQVPDSLMAAIDELALRVKWNKDTYKYLVHTCAYKYQKPTIMGMDEVFVRIYDKYYESGEMDYWVNKAMKKSMKDYADKLRNSLIGKTAVNLVMQDQNKQRRALYDITNKKYSLIYIFDPDCGHCKEETPKLVTFYNQSKDKFNLEVFAVDIDSSMQKMRDYIKTMKMPWITVNGPRSYSGSLFNNYYADTTPMLYILDSKRKIIAKGLPVDRIEDFLVNHEKFERRKAALKARQQGAGK
jgi:thiol-disulfide isomerase/thioredoxin